MKLYLVTETSKENNMYFRSWACTTKEKAIECLNERYKIATMLNKEAGKPAPVDTRKYEFFYWELDQLTLRYNINESTIY